MFGFHPLSDQPISSIASGSSTNNYIITPSGGIVFSGDVNFVKGKILAISGGITFAGTAAFIKGKIIQAAGGISFGGTAPITFNSGGGGATIPPQRTMVGTGT